jgi:hypothetical protein
LVVVVVVKLSLGTPAATGETLPLHFLHLLPLLEAVEVLVIWRPAFLEVLVAVVVEMAVPVHQELQDKVMVVELEIPVENLIETVLVVVVLVVLVLMDLLLEVGLEEMENQVLLHMDQHHQ